MIQILFTICFGALAGWLTFVLGSTKKRLALITHILIGLMGGLLGLYVYKNYVTESVGGNLYGILLSLSMSLTLVVIARNFTRD